MTGSCDYYTMYALPRWEGEGGGLDALPESHHARDRSEDFMTVESTPMNDNKTTVTDMDLYRLSRLLACSETAAYGSRRSRFDLETKLEEAEAVPAQRAPRSLVTMNSRIVLIDVESGDRRVFTLVYPEDRDLIPHSVGILQPLGQRILGRCQGDVVHIVEGGAPRQFRIDSIEYQPESVGAYQL